MTWKVCYCCATPVQDMYFFDWLLLYFWPTTSSRPQLLQLHSSEPVVQNNNELKRVNRSVHPNFILAGNTNESNQRIRNILTLPMKQKLSTRPNSSLHSGRKTLNTRFYPDDCSTKDFHLWYSIFHIFLLLLKTSKEQEKADSFHLPFLRINLNETGEQKGVQDT